MEDKDWYALEAAGWKVHWVKDEPAYYDFLRADADGRWLGALATVASKEDTTMKQAIAEFEDVTGQNSSDLGCSCCGTPHSFEFENEDGVQDFYEPSFPSYGDRYDDY